MREREKGEKGGGNEYLQSFFPFQEPGWRERARKMLVFSTDAGFHFAGDGRVST